MKKVVWKLHLHDDKEKKKAMKIASGFEGVDTVSMDKDMKLTVTGDIDPVKLTGKLRKLCTAYIVAVGPVGKKGDDEDKNKKGGEKQQSPCYFPPYFTSPSPYYFGGRNFSREGSKDNKKGDDKDKKGGERRRQTKVDTCLQDKTGNQSKQTRVTEDQSTIVDDRQPELDGADPEHKDEKQNALEGSHQEAMGWMLLSEGNDPSLGLSYWALLRKKVAEWLDMVQRRYMKKQSDMPYLTSTPVPLQDVAREEASLKDKVEDQSEQTRGSNKLSITEFASTELDVGDTKKFPELKYKEQNAPESHQKNIQASHPALKDEAIPPELSLGLKMHDSETFKKFVGKHILTSESGCKIIMETTSEQICRDMAMDEMSSSSLTQKQQAEAGRVVMGDSEACRPDGVEESDCSTSELEYEDTEKVSRKKYKKKKASEGSQQEYLWTSQISEQSSDNSSNDNSKSQELPFCEAKQQREQSKGMTGAKYDLIAGHILEKVRRSNAEKIGIHGRDGVDKRNVIEALSSSEKLKTLFDRVILVKMSANSEIKTAQMKIAQEICPECIDSHEEEISQRVTHLLKNSKFLLILDDIPMNLELKAMKIAMSTSEYDSKIILVATSEQMWKNIAVDEVISLDDELSWDLFSRNASELVHSADIQPVAREIVKLCNHCSRAIVLMACALKNECEYSTWIVARNKLLLEVGSDGEVEDIMSAAVEFSFESIDDEMTMKCLKNIALDENKAETTKESLVSNWIRDGLVSTINEGNKVLKNLIDLNLLEIDEHKDFVMLRDLDRDIFVNFVIRPEESSMFVMKGGLGLVEPPDDDEWEIAKEISLMQNEIFKLPESPLCPSLSALFLQRNQKLRVIPPPFFLHMPSLQVLNLSKTRIRSLPESFFQLSSLKRLFLRECILLRRLPAEIRNLKQLEVLDLEGTKLVALPAAVGELENLTCLEVSISESENHKETTKGSPIIPCEVVSTLSQMEELNIGIDPEAEWWGSCVECIINEICSLKKLDKLNFYFPNEESLNHFNQLWRTTEHQTLSQFYFIVGRHANRIMSQIPTDAELELERWSKCLKYINGVGVHDDIEEILSDSEALFLERNSSIKKLSEFGVECLQRMKCCVLGECNELTMLVDGADLDEGDDFGNIESNPGRIFLGSLEYLYVYHMKNLATIWKGAPTDGSLLYLKCLTLKTCPRLTCVFTECLLGNLCNLEELVVDDCPAVVSLVTCENVSSVKTSVFLPMLRRIILHYVPELTSISGGLRIAPKLELLSFYNCEKLKSLSVEDVSSKDLRKIRGNLSWWKELQWLGGDRPDTLDDIFVPVDILEVP